MTREEKFEKVNLILEKIEKDMLKEDACKLLKMKVDTFDKELIIRLAMKDYLEGNNSISFVSNKYGINRKSIERRLKEQGIPAKKIINCYQDAFDSIDTEEKAYWLGFIYADGYVCANTYSIGFGLKEEDKDTVKAFTEFMKFNGGCNIVRTTKFHSKEKGGYMCTTQITNKYLWESLVNKGAVPHKSLILEFPKEEWFKDKSLIYHFLRGYCDGDGTLGVYPRNKKDPNSYMGESLMFVGTKPFLEGVQKYLGKGYLMHKTNCGEKTYRLSYGTQKANNAARLMYENAKIYLPRKKKIYDEKFVPRNREKTVNPETEIPC